MCPNVIFRNIMEEHPRLSRKWTWDECGNRLVCSEHPFSVQATFIRKKLEKTETMSMQRSIAPSTNAPKMVTFHDVKAVATSRMLEAKELPGKFLKLLRSYPIDVYLARLVLYFGWFIKKNELRNVVHKYHIEKSTEEREEYDFVCIEVQMARKLLGMAYANLLLGLDNCQTHHTRCGQTTNSDTLGDRLMFETLLQFSYVFVWICMGRREQDTIKNEINRLVRTEAFITEPVPVGGAKEERSNSIVKGETKQLQIKMRQRSKVIGALLPTAEEKSKHLVNLNPRKKKAQSPMKLYCPTKENDLERFIAGIEDFNPYFIKVGIMGEPIYKFNPVSLSPLDVETEEETEILNSQSKTNVEKYLETKQVFLEQEEQLRKLKLIFEEL